MSYLGALVGWFDEHEVLPLPSPGLSAVGVEEWCGRSQTRELGGGGAALVIEVLN